MGNSMVSQQVDPMVLPTIHTFRKSFGPVPSQGKLGMCKGNWLRLKIPRLMPLPKTVNVVAVVLAGWKLNVKW